MNYEEVNEEAAVVARAVITSILEVHLAKAAELGAPDLSMWPDDDHEALIEWPDLLRDLPEDPNFGPLVVGHLGQLASYAVWRFARSAGITAEEALQEIFRVPGDPQPSRTF